jgi:hypothetical protein
MMDPEFYVAANKVGIEAGSFRFLCRAVENLVHRHVTWAVVETVRIAFFCGELGANLSCVT